MNQWTVCIKCHTKIDEADRHPLCNCPDILRDRIKELEDAIKTMAAQQDADRAVGREAGITHHAVRDIFTAYTSEEISQGRAVELLRELVQGALNKITLENQ